ncbi:Ig-like domain-containing protein [Balneola sp. MJW-20]|uniref:Ig-like domain-containing protein n=1 Tax=Gracilimonas aurantiaca TaxID=3234185 RepID=UPI0034674AE5
MFKCSWAYILLSIILILTGCKKKGGGITGSDDPATDPPVPPAITSTFDDPETFFDPGQIVTISVDGSTLEKDEYEATLSDGSSLTLYKNLEDSEKKTLVMVVPEITSQSHTLEFEIKDQSQALDFEVNPYEPIDDPLAYSTQQMDQLENELNVLIQSISDESFKQQIIATRDSIVEQRAHISELSEQDIASLARFLEYTTSWSSTEQVNVAYVNGSDWTPCDTKKAVIYTVSVVGIAAGFAIVNSGTLINIGPWGGAAVLTAAGALITSVNYLRNNYQDFTLNCSENTNTDILDELSRASKQKQVDRSFVHAEADSVFVQSTYFAPSELVAKITVFRDILDNLMEFIPQEWFDAINQDEVVKVNNPNTFTIEGLSDSEISGQTGQAGEQLSLKFEYIEGVDPVQSRTFTFNLNSTEGINLEVNAELLPPIPVAYGMETFTVTGELLQDTLKADYAGTFQVVSETNYGPLNLVDPEAGIFTYEAVQGYSGRDSFQYNVSNDAGTSETKTVTIIVDNGYVIQFGDYHPDYVQITPQITVQKGDNLNLYNFTKRMVRLVYKGEPVTTSVGGWSEVAFGNHPESREDVILEDYEITLYDGVNERSVTTTINKLTLSNFAYRFVMDNTFRVNYNQIVQFNSDGTYEWWYDSEPNNITTDTYNFYIVITPNWVQCNDGTTLDKMIVGVVKFGVGSGYMYVYEDGTASANSYLACPDFHNYVPIDVL